jgi:hypothetical protein
LADESTSSRNEMELSIVIRVVEDKVPKEKFMEIVKIPTEKQKPLPKQLTKK